MGAPLPICTLHLRAVLRLRATRSWFGEVSKGSIDSCSEPRLYPADIDGVDRTKADGWRDAMPG